MTLVSNGLNNNTKPYTWTFADATARTSATGFVAADVGSWAIQLSDGTIWELTATTPAWAQRGGITGGGGGAPTSAKYVTTAADATLSAEVVLPGLAASMDVPGAIGPMVAAGTTISEHFDTTTEPVTWSPSAPTTHDSDTTLASHLYAKTTDTTVRLALWSYAPAADFDVRCQITLGGWGTSGAGLILTDSGNNSIAHLLLATNGDGPAQLASNQGSGFTAVVAAANIGLTALYLRINRVSGAVSYWYSTDGKLWVRYGNVASLTTAVAKVGYRFYQVTASASAWMASDWLRAS